MYRSRERFRLHLHYLQPVKRWPSLRLPQRIRIKEEYRITREFPSVPVIGQAVPLNAGDVESALAYWAEAATVALIGYPPTVRDSYNGREQVRGWLNKLAARHYRIQVKVLKVQGNAVTTRTEMWSDWIMQLDVAPLVATEVYLVNDRKITQLTSTISPKSLLRFQSALHAEQEKGGGFIQDNTHALFLFQPSYV